MPRRLRRGDRDRSHADPAAGQRPQQGPLRGGHHHLSGAGRGAAGADDAGQTPKDKFGGVKEATARARGWILYLKSSLTGDEPADVIEYQSRNPQFPHQSTGDQFFSESQFESYRRLGLHVVREAFEGVTPKVGDVTRWTAPPAAALAAGKASVAADRQVMQKCRETSPFTATKIDVTEIFQKLTTKWYPASR